MKANRISAALLFAMILSLQPSFANAKIKKTVVGNGIWMSKTISYTHLDLSSAAGREQLQLLVERAAKQVCKTPRAVTLAERQDQSRCMKQARSDALAKSSAVIAKYNQDRLSTPGGSARAGTK